MGVEVAMEFLAASGSAHCMPPQQISRRGRLMGLLLLVLAVLPATGAELEKPKVNPNGPPPGAWLHDGRPQGLIIAAPPFSWATDNGANAAEQKKFLQRIAKPVDETTKFFKKVYGLKESCFEDFVKQSNPGGGLAWEPLIRVNLWRAHADFQGDFQQRSESKVRLAAVFSRAKVKDEYAKETGKLCREVATSCEEDDAGILRELYHELGHLFMYTYMTTGAEIPSWIEEGTAELFQYRTGNGTKPEGERLERQGWLREILEENKLVPWSDMLKVSNLDNLESTWRDPSKTTIHYLQAWSVIEFMVNNPQRQAAFLKMLEKFKKSTQAAIGSKITKTADFETYLYGIQEDTFKECYGTTFSKVEDVWKLDWVTKEYERLLPKNPILLYHRGNWLLMFRQNPKDEAANEAVIATAKSRFDECVALAPTCPEGYVGLGKIAVIRQQYDEAQKQYDIALKLNPNSYDAQLNGGIAKIESGIPADAVPLLTKAVAARPTSWDAQFELGRALAIEGRDLAAAKHAFTRATDLHKSVADNCAMFLGTAYFAAKDYANASTAFLDAAYAAPGNGEMFMLTALCEAWRQDTTTALSYLDRAPAGESIATLRKLISEKKPLPEIIFKKSRITIMWPAP